MLDVVQVGGELGGGVYQFFVVGIVFDIEQDCIVGVLDFFLVLVVVSGVYLFIDVVGGVVQGQFVQCNQIVFVEKVFDSVFGLVVDVDFVFIELLVQIVRGEVYQYYVVCGVKEGIGNCFLYLYVGDFVDDVIQIFQMLDVNGSENIYFGFQQFIYILLVFWMVGVWCIVVCQFIYQN